MKILILSCERDQQIKVVNFSGKVLLDQTYSYDEYGSAGRDAVKDIVIDLAKILSITVVEEEVTSLGDS